MKENTPPNTRYNKPISSQGIDHWNAFKGNYNINVTDLLYSIARSEVECTMCKQTSIQFDPILGLQVQVRKNIKSTLRNYMHREFIEDQYDCLTCR
jgi:ubiquitin C-terminal hydrolase